jgi:hypothetical protein
MFCSCCKNLPWKKITLAALVFTAISFVFDQISAFLTMGYYQDPAYFGVWSKLMMPGPGAPPLSFFLLSLLFSLVTGKILAIAYYFVKDKLAAKGWPKALDFTCFIGGLYFVLSFLPSYLIINLPLVLLVSWFASALVVVFLAALIFEKILV